MKRKAGFAIAAATALTAMLVAACGTAATQAVTAGSNPSVPNDPVTITVTYYNVTLSDEEFQKYWVEPTKAKYPNITLQLIKQGQGTNFNDLIAAGKTPDIIFASNGYFNLFKQYDLMQDLSGYIKKYNVDLNQYNKPAMEVVKRAGEQGEIYSIPFSLNYGALYYNKTIFDKLGVPYPQDLMSWEDLLPLAKQLTRTVDGVQYIGLEPGNADTIAAELGKPTVGADDMPVINGPEYQRVFNYLKEIYSIPGQIGPNNQSSWSRTNFLKDQNIAMFADWTNDIASPLEQAFKSGFSSWDVSGLPNFSDKLGIGRPVDAHLAVISKSSPHKEQAFQVLLQTVSKETEMKVSAGGLISSMDDPAIRDNFGKDLQSFQGKHLQNIFKTTMAVVPKGSTYGTKVSSIVRDEQKNMALGKKDVNTALKDAQERALQNVQEEKSQSK